MTTSGESFGSFALLVWASIAFVSVVTFWGGVIWLALALLVRMSTDSPIRMIVVGFVLGVGLSIWAFIVIEFGGGCGSPTYP